MRVVRYMVIASAAISLCTSALAFQETEAPVTGSLKSGLGDSKSKSDSETVLSLPGLGNLGVIPKLDFGLDLLYGQDGAKSNAVEAAPDNDDGLRIRGSIKHRF